MTQIPFAFDESAFVWAQTPSARFSSSHWSISQGMETIWQMDHAGRPLPLEANAQAEALYCWWLIDGLRLYPYIPFSMEAEDFFRLCQAEILPAGLPLPLWLHGYWRARPDLRATFDLANAESLAGLVIWFYTLPDLPEGLSRSLSLHEETLALLNRPATGLPLPLWLHGYWLARPDLREKFDLTTDESLAGLVVWF